MLSSQLYCFHQSRLDHFLYLIYGDDIRSYGLDDSNVPYAINVMLLVAIPIAIPLGILYSTFVQVPSNGYTTHGIRLTISYCIYKTN